MNSIKEAKQFIEKNIYKGVICPCCSRFNKIYKRKFNSGMAKTLIQIFQKNTSNDFFHITVCFSKNKNSIYENEYSKLRYWNLLEPDLTRKGYWKITELGRNFVNGIAKIPKFIYIKDKKLVSFGSELVNIEEGLENKFNYSELMNTQATFA